MILRRVRELVGTTFCSWHAAGVVKHEHGERRRKGEAQGNPMAFGLALNFEKNSM